MSKYVIIIITMITIIICNCQDIVFPNDEETSHLSGISGVITDRIPIYIPDKCPINMLLYPGGGSKSAWICDCRPRYLYFPLNNTCYEAYRQGPCNNGEYVILPVGEALPKCHINPCHDDGLVYYNGTCYNLRMTGGPCAPDGVLGVNDITFQIQCFPINVAPFSVIHPAPSLKITTPCTADNRHNNIRLCNFPT